MSAFIVVHNQSRSIQDPPRIQKCESFLCRLRGLMFRPGLAANEGLLLAIARDSLVDSSIHMFFVPFDLAVFWINSGFEVVDKVLAKSWRPAYFPRRSARYTLEIHPDHFEDFDIGDKVEFHDA